MTKVQDAMAYLADAPPLGDIAERHPNHGFDLASVLLSLSPNLSLQWEKQMRFPDIQMTCKCWIIGFCTLITSYILTERFIGFWLKNWETSIFMKILRFQETLWPLLKTNKRIIFVFLFLFCFWSRTSMRTFGTYLRSISLVIRCKIEKLWFLWKFTILKNLSIGVI